MATSRVTRSRGADRPARCAPARDLEQLVAADRVLHVCLEYRRSPSQPRLLAGACGWSLAPAYDMNPVATAGGLTLNVSETDNAQELALARDGRQAISTHVEARERDHADVIAVVRGWRVEAKKLGLSRSARTGMAAAFRWRKTPDASPPAAPYTPNTRSDRRFTISIYPSVKGRQGCFRTGKRGRRPGIHAGVAAALARLARTARQAAALIGAVRVPEGQHCAPPLQVWPAGHVEGQETVAAVVAPQRPSQWGTALPDRLVDTPEQAASRIPDAGDGDGHVAHTAGHANAIALGLATGDRLEKFVNSGSTISCTCRR